MSGRARVRAAAAALLALGALAAPPLAAAHAILIRVGPADGSRLSSSPEEIRLTFSEAISPRFRSVQLLAPGGRAVAGVHVRSVTASRLALAVPRLRKGTYAVAWRVLAEDDGHTTSGTVVFRIGTGSVPAPQATHEPLPAVTDVTLRWLRFTFSALLLGSLAFAFCVLGAVRAPRAPVECARRRVLTAAIIGSGLAALVGVAALVRQAVSTAALADGMSTLGVLPGLMSSRWGLLWSAEEAAALALGALALVGRRHRASWPVLTVALPLGVLLATAEALGSHAAALKSSFAIAADALHVGAAGIWIGGVAAFALAVWPARGLGRRESASLARACRGRFAVLASGSAVLVVVTGLYAAGLQVASVDALLTTFYGRALLAKTALAGAAAAIGALNFLLLARLARSGSVRHGILLAEVRVGCAVFLAAGILTASVPALGPAFAAPRPVHVATLVRQADDLLVSVTVRPNRPGDNVFTAVTASSRRPPPAPIGSIEARLGPGGARVSLSRVEPDRFVGVGRLANSGDSRMVVLVRRGRATVRMPIRWSVESRDPARAVSVSDRRLSSIVNPAALLLLGAAVAGAIFLLLRRLSPTLSRVPTVRGESP